MKYAFILFISLISATSVMAGGVWQMQSNEPCPAQERVGDSGNDNNSYIIPATPSSYDSIRPEPMHQQAERAYQDKSYEEDHSSSFDAYKGESEGPASADRY